MRNPAPLAALLLIAGCSPADRQAIRQDVEGLRQQARKSTESVRQSAADSALAGKVQTALGSRKGLEGAEIRAEASGSDVTLRGTVRSREQALLAARIALETEGVSTVHNELTLQVPAVEQPAGPPAGR